MAKKYAVIVESGCAGCEELKKAQPNLPYLDVKNNPNGAKLADSLGVKYVPSVISVDDQGKICVLDEKMKVVKCILNKASEFPSLTKILRG